MAIEAIQNCFSNISSGVSSGCGSVSSSIASIPNAIQTQLEECCTTDCKIYGLLILGRVLQAAAILGVAATIFAACVATPLALLAAIPAVALGVLGTYMAARPEEIHDAIFPLPPYVPGQPVGMINTGNNCWGIAGLQLLFNSPNLMALPAVQRVAEIGQISQSYATTQNESRRVMQDVNVQALRDALLRENALDVFPGLDPRRTQQDVARFFEYLFQEPHSLYSFERSAGGVLREGPPRNEPFVSLQLNPAGGDTFEGLVQGFFNYPFTNNLYDAAGHVVGEEELEMNLRFPASAPDDLMIQLRRFYQDPATGRLGRNGHNVPVPPNFALDARYSRAGGAANYECDGFIIHYGGESGGGHYVSYIKKPDNTWWACNDRTVRPITDQAAHRLMNQGYIYHFRKVQPQATA